METLQRNAVRLALISLIGLTCGSWPMHGEPIRWRTSDGSTLADAARSLTQAALRGESDTVSLLLPRVNGWPRASGPSPVGFPAFTLRTGYYADWLARVAGYPSELLSLAAQHVRLQI